MSSKLLFSSLIFISNQIFTTSYVDSTRRTAVNLSGGAGEDLKRLMGEKKLLSEEDAQSGISIDVTFLKQAEHLLRTAKYAAAINYTIKALEVNPESKVGHFLRGGEEGAKSFQFH